MDDLNLGENDLHRDRGAEFVAGLGTVSVAQLTNGDYDEDCPICHSSYGPWDPAQVRCCGRAFHKGCLGEWLSQGQNNTCPICRVELFVKLQDEEEDEDEDDNEEEDGDGEGGGEEEEDNGIGWPGQEEECQIGGTLEDYGIVVGDDCSNDEDREWMTDYIRNYNDIEPSAQSDEYILNQLRTGRRHKWGYLGHRYQYQELLVDGADLPPLDFETRDLTIDQDLALFRELQRRGCFKVGWMRREYWERRGWGDFRTYEHLARLGTLWCAEHQRWFRLRS